MNEEQEPVFGWRALRRLLARGESTDGYVPPDEKRRLEEERDRWAERARVADALARVQARDRR